MVRLGWPDDGAFPLLWDKQTDLLDPEYKAPVRVAPLLVHRPKSENQEGDHRERERRQRHQHRQRHPKREQRQEHEQKRLRGERWRRRLSPGEGNDGG